MSPAPINPAAIRLRVAENRHALYHRIGDGDHAVTVRDHLGRGDTLACLTCHVIRCEHTAAVGHALDAASAQAAECAA